MTSTERVTALSESGKFDASTPLLMAQAFMSDVLEDRVEQIILVVRDGIGGVHVTWDDSLSTADVCELAMALRLESERVFAMTQHEIEEARDDKPPGE